MDSKNIIVVKRNIAAIKDEVQQMIGLGAVIVLQELKGFVEIKSLRRPYAQIKLPASWFVVLGPPDLLNTIMAAWHLNRIPHWRRKESWPEFIQWMERNTINES